MKPQTIDEYIDAQDETVQPRLREVHEILRTAIPNIIHFAASKKHLGLYPGGEATTVFAEELRGWDVCKGTIRLPWKNELPTELIQRIARWCYEEYSS